MSEDLKSCPFCGYWARIYISSPVDKFASYKAICWNDVCKVQTPWYKTFEEAQQAWDKRV